MTSVLRIISGIIYDQVYLPVMRFSRQNDPLKLTAYILVVTSSKGHPLPTKHEKQLIKEHSLKEV